MMFVESKYNIGDIIYLKTDVEQVPRMVVSIWIRPNGVTYEVVSGVTSSWHFDVELSTEIDLAIKNTS
jgi:hypothetical protein